MMSDSPLLAGVMGWPLTHTLSPRLHGYWLNIYGIAGRYDALPVPPAALPTSLRALQQQRLRGVNLTIPHKEAACALVDTLDEDASLIGAVNLVTVTAEGKLLGRNTDAYGFSENLKTNDFLKGNIALILGAGGAARAIIVALLKMGFTEIRIANRTMGRAENLARQFSSQKCRVTAVAWNEAPLVLHDLDLLINATSLGMKDQPPLEISLKTLNPSAAVTDIVYTPFRTPLLQAAQAANHRTIDGLGMLLHQARPAFAAFYGRNPEVTEQLRSALRADRTNL